jgi:hypothetical protein
MTPPVALQIPLAITIDRGYIGGGSQSAAFWRTMLGDFIIKEFLVRRATNAHHRRFSNFIKHLMQNELYISIRDMVVSQAFFITGKGYIRISPPNIQVSDEVWVLFGSNVLFIWVRLKWRQYSITRITLVLYNSAMTHTVYT